MTKSTLRYVIQIYFLLQSYLTEHDEKPKHENVFIQHNLSTYIQVEIKSSKDIDIEKPNNIGKILGFKIIKIPMSNFQYHLHTPYAKTTIYNIHEIRILIQTRDRYKLPSQSYLYLEGKLTNSEEKFNNTLRFINNGVNILIDEIRYEL